jgi:hypothetical protein
MVAGAELVRRLNRVNALIARTRINPEPAA